MTEAWVTLATSDGYAVGALVLASSLKAVQTTRKLHCMVTTGVSQHLRDQLAATFDAINLVNVLDSEDTANLRLIGRPDLGVTFTKIYCWRLTQYTKCVFLDADCLVVQNADELFEHDELSAVADIGWPDCFNSGVFVYRPSEQTYLDILNFAVEHGSFDGGDQGLLNQFFKGWRDKPPAFRLPFIYNMTSGAIYTYAAAFKKYGAQVKIVHFLGAVKPWQQSSGSVHFSEHLTYWWSLFKNRVAPKFDTSHVSSSRSSSPPQCTTVTDTAVSTTATTTTTSTTTAPAATTASSSDQETSAYGQRSAPAVQVTGDQGLHTGAPPDPSCMPVFRCVPPLYEAWRPLRHLPTHLAQQMAAFSLGPTARLLRSDLACPEVPGITSGIEQTSPPTDEERMRAWEVGHPDYLGADAYENIQKAIDNSMK